VSLVEVILVASPPGWNTLNCRSCYNTRGRT
jgi:hypothetical protein